MNQITIMGELKFDARARQTNNGDDVADALVKVLRTGKGFEDFRVSAWGAVAGKLAPLRKGDWVAIAGTMENRRFQPQGSEEWKDKWEVQAKQVTLVGAPPTAAAAPSRSGGNEWDGDF